MVAYTTTVDPWTASGSHLQGVTMILLNDTHYDAAKIREHRQMMIGLRDTALANHNFEWAVILSVTVGLLEELARREEEHEGTNKGATEDLGSLSN